MSQTNVVNVVEATPKNAGFASNRKYNTTDEKIKREEEELEALKNPPSNDDEDDDNSNNAELSAEERTFKKRYGDLRRHSQKIEKELKDELDNLREQLKSATHKELELPANPDDLKAWMDKYPDVAKIVETIAIQKARETNKEIETKFESLTKEQQKVAEERAEAMLLKAHPDFFEIADTDEFHEWLEKQVKPFQDAIYDNKTDYQTAISVVDYFKLAHNMTGKKKGGNESRDAARAVTRKTSTSKPVETNMDGVYYESKVDKMSAAQYEREHENIMEAIRTGKFVYDLSGGAR